MSVNFLLGFTGVLRSVTPPISVSVPYGAGLTLQIPSAEHEPLALVAERCLAVCAAPSSAR